MYVTTSGGKECHVVHQGISPGMGSAVGKHCLGIHNHIYFISNLYNVMLIINQKQHWAKL